MPARNTTKELLQETVTRLLRDSSYDDIRVSDIEKYCGFCLTKNSELYIEVKQYLVKCALEQVNENLQEQIYIWEEDGCYRSAQTAYEYLVEHFTCPESCNEIILKVSLESAEARQRFSCVIKSHYHLILKLLLKAQRHSDDQQTEKEEKAINLFYQLIGELVISNINLDMNELV